MRLFVAFLFGFLCTGVALGDSVPSEKQYPYIQLMGKFCLKSDHEACEEVVIVDSEQSHEVEIPYEVEYEADGKTEKGVKLAVIPFTAAACVMHGEESVRKYFFESNKPAKYFIAAWKCKHSNREISSEKGI